MKLEEKELKSELVYKGAIFDVIHDTVELPNGHTAYRDVVVHPGAVAMFAVNDKNEVYLVKQYRYAVQRNMIEIPAGKLDKPGEDPFDAAKRELKEEIGCTADKWDDLGVFIGSPGCNRESLHLYLARGLHQGELEPDEDEFLEQVLFPFDELMRQIETGEIIDAKTIIAAYKVRDILASA